MTYHFAGFLAASRIKQPERLPERAVWREIDRPFAGVGLRLPEFIGERPEPAVVSRFADELGFATSHSWLYLTYTCWGGVVDFVFGFGAKNGHPFGPLESDEHAEDIYVELMSKLGVNEKSALDFEPFRRGFWGET